MKIQVNNSVIEVDSKVSIHHLFEIISSPSQGVAVAVNDTVVPRSMWATFVLNENDNVLVIKATRGG